MINTIRLSGPNVTSLANRIKNEGFSCLDRLDSMTICRMLLGITTDRFGSSSVVDITNGILNSCEDQNHELGMILTNKYRLGVVWRFIIPIENNEVLYLLLSKVPHAERNTIRLSLQYDTIAKELDGTEYNATVARPLIEYTSENITIYKLDAKQNFERGKYQVEETPKEETPDAPVDEPVDTPTEAEEASTEQLADQPGEQGSDSDDPGQEPEPAEDEGEIRGEELEPSEQQETPVEAEAEADPAPSELVFKVCDCFDDEDYEPGSDEDIRKSIADKILDKDNLRETIYQTIREAVGELPQITGDEEFDDDNAAALFDFASGEDELVKLLGAHGLKFVSSGLNEDRTAYYLGIDLIETPEILEEINRRSEITSGVPDKPTEEDSEPPDITVKLNFVCQSQEDHTYEEQVINDILLKNNLSRKLITVATNSFRQYFSGCDLSQPIDMTTVQIPDNLVQYMLAHGFEIKSVQMSDDNSECNVSVQLIFTPAVEQMIAQRKEADMQAAETPPVKSDYVDISAPEYRINTLLAMFGTTNPSANHVHTYLNDYHTALKTKSYLETKVDGQGTYPTESDVFYDDVVWAFVKMKDGRFWRISIAHRDFSLEDESWIATRHIPDRWVHLIDIQDGPSYFHRRRGNW